MGKLCLVVATMAAAMSFTGCMSTMPIGPGCADFGCNDCCGATVGTQYIANGPLDALRNARRQMTCGAGCGETYVGEWISTPPDSVDPCCGSQFAGGATKCRPFCWQPGNLFRGIYGQRICSDSASSMPCGCASGGCDGGCGVADNYVGGSVISSGAPASSCGCASHQGVPSGTQFISQRTDQAAPSAQTARGGQRLKTARPVVR